MPKTKIIKIDSQKPEKEEIKKIAQKLKKGGLIIFPTDTLYGLGGNALNKNIVKKIFNLKKRPTSKPISINIAYKKDLKKYVKKIPTSAKKLIKEFWPGPLTIIFEKSKIIPNELTGGSPYIGVRIPDNKITLEIIKKSGLPLTSPSANLSGKKPPTTAKQTKKDFLNKVNIIIDGDETTTKEGSTIIDLSKEKSLILREGAIPIKKLNKFI
jgi:L-threonylcarbamoyladenylate synthase